MERYNVCLDKFIFGIIDLERYASIANANFKQHRTIFNSLFSMDTQADVNAGIGKLKDFELASIRVMDNLKDAMIKMNTLYNAHFI